MARKSAEIATLLRVQSWAVDEQRRFLGQLLGREESLRADLARMEQELIEEQRVASSDPTLAGHGYSGFAERYRDRRANLLTVIDAVMVEIEQQRERLAAVYRDLKVLEQVQQNWREQEQQAEARREQAEMDEIAQNRRLV